MPDHRFQNQIILGFLATQALPNENFSLIPNVPQGNNPPFILCPSVTLHDCFLASSVSPTPLLIHSSRASFNSLSRSGSCSITISSANFSSSFWTQLRDNFPHEDFPDNSLSLGVFSLALVDSCSLQTKSLSYSDVTASLSPWMANRVEAPWRLRPCLSRLWLNL